MSLSHTAELSDRDQLPDDWLDRFGARLARYDVDIQLEMLYSYFMKKHLYPRDFLQIGYPWLSQYDGSILSGETLPEDLGFGYSFHFLNKTAYFYMAHGGDPMLPWKANSDSFPINVEEWLGVASSTWAKECSLREIYDGRFALAPFRLSIRNEERLRKAVGLGEQPEGSLEELVDSLIAFHIQHCERVNARATDIPVTPADVKAAARCGWINQEMADRQLSILFPTCKAVLLIGRTPMAKGMAVLLVLTGHSQDMMSGAPTFKAIPESEIISRRAEHILEVSLPTAMRYLRQLERREEAANGIFRERNAQRKDALFASMLNYARSSVAELARETHGTSVTSQSESLLGGLMRDAWERLVDDERYFEILEDTKDLRGI